MKHLIFILIAISIFSGCQSDYDKLVKSELAKGEIHEDIFLSLVMGMTKKEYFDECWQLNKQQLLSQGPGNNYAKYTWMPDDSEEEGQKVEILFYGMFDDQDVMHGMDFIMNFLPWSPWNKQYQSDVLIEFMKQKYLKKFGGNEFLEIKINKDKTAWVKVDGNRQIRMYPLNSKDISVKITDLRIDPKSFK